MPGAINEIALVVLAGVDDGRLGAVDGERFLGRLLLEAVGGAGDSGMRRELIALGVEPSLLEKAVDQLRMDGGAAPRTDAPAAGKPASEVDAVLRSLVQLGDPAEWEAATAYDSAALAIIDSVWSISVRYGGVLNVLERYRVLRRVGGRDPELDTPADLACCIASMGGPKRSPRRSETASARPREAGFSRPRRCFARRRCSPTRTCADRATWPRHRRLDSTSSGAAGRKRYRARAPGCLLMLLGMQGVKSDRMIRRFVADALGSSEAAVSMERAHALVTALAERLHVGASKLDYAIWRYQSCR